MLVVLASQVDSVATRFVAEHQAALMTPRDLCTTGWRVELGHLDRAMIVANGVARSACEITGVLNLLPYLCEQELVTIERADRSYVAAEISSFLFYLLNALTCPVVNRPGAPCLAGAGWRPEQWALACRDVGIPAARIGGRHRDASTSMESMRSVSVLGNTFVEGAELPFAARVLDLADVARVTFLRINFVDEGTRFHSAQVTPHLYDDHHRAAIGRFFDGATS